MNFKPTTSSFVAYLRYGPKRSAVGPRATACPHPDRRNYSRGRCQECHTAVRRQQALLATPLGLTVGPRQVTYQVPLGPVAAVAACPRCGGAIWDDGREQGCLPCARVWRAR